MALLNLSPIGNFQQWFNNQGIILAGGLLYTYAAGTTNPIATYISQVGATPNANPIQLDSTGEAPQEIWLTPGQAYKFVLTDTGGNVLATIDNVVGINDVNFPAGIVSGTVMIFQQTIVPVGWTRISVFDGTMLRVVGSATPSNGGTNDMVSVLVNPLTVDGHALTITEMPNHAHADTFSVTAAGSTVTYGGVAYGDGNVPSVSYTTDNGGAGGAPHNHSLQFNVKYVDTMVCFKN